MGALHLADLPRSLQSHPPAASVASPSAQRASYLHGVLAPQPSRGSRPLGPCLAPLPGQAGRNRQCDREDGGRERGHRDALTLQPAVWILLFLFQVLSPATCRPSRAHCTPSWVPARRLLPSVEPACPRPPACSCRLAGEEPQSCAGPADSTATHRGARRPQGRKQKHSSSLGGSLSSSPHQLPRGRR